MNSVLPTVSRILRLPEFNRLREIGGHRVYHLEGDALTHTLLVMSHAIQRFGLDSEMVIVALLHDVGKIYTGIEHGPNDWNYPNHAKVGAAKLGNFLPLDYPQFSAIQWYIANHIKPLFWRDKDLREEIAKLQVPEGCSVIALAELAICDIQGSISVTPQTELLEFLQDFVSSRKGALSAACTNGLYDEVLAEINHGATPTEALREWDLL